VTRVVRHALGHVFTPGLLFDNAEKRVLRLASIWPRSSVSCAAVTLRTRFIAFRRSRCSSRPVVNTQPSGCNGRCVCEHSTLGRSCHKTGCRVIRRGLEPRGPARPGTTSRVDPTISAQATGRSDATVRRQARRAAWRLAGVGRLLQRVGVREQLVFREFAAQQLGAYRHAQRRRGGGCRESRLKGDRRKPVPLDSGPLRST
jgi:hypothetical protein